jgi:hypothetical protein
LKSFIASAAFAAGTLIAAGSALADDVRVPGVPFAVHRGVNNYAFGIPGKDHAFVIPMTGFGSVVQALRVDQAARDREPIVFFGDCAQIIEYHEKSTGCYAHDID